VALPVEGVNKVERVWTIACSRAWIRAKDKDSRPTTNPKSGPECHFRIIDDVRMIHFHTVHKITDSLCVFLPCELRRVNGNQFNFTFSRNSRVSLCILYSIQSCTDFFNRMNAVDATLCEEFQDNYLRFRFIGQVRYFFSADWFTSCK